MDGDFFFIEDHDYLDKPCLPKKLIIIPESVVYFG
jgi:hypothetical protein